MIQITPQMRVAAAVTLDDEPKERRRKPQGR
jgi:hypothetical protein